MKRKAIANTKEVRTVVSREARIVENENEKGHFSFTSFTVVVLLTALPIGRKSSQDVSWVRVSLTMVADSEIVV